MQSTHENPETHLLKVDEAAQRCRVSRPTMYRLISSGIVPAVRLGADNRGPIRIDAAELHEWLYADERSSEGNDR